MHLARAGEIVLVELPDAAWSETAAPGSFHSRSPHCARSRSVRMIEGEDFVGPTKVGP
jgi:hypothetical protein